MITAKANQLKKALEAQGLRVRENREGNFQLGQGYLLQIHCWNGNCILWRPLAGTNVRRLDTAFFPGYGKNWAGTVAAGIAKQAYHLIIY